MRITGQWENNTVWRISRGRLSCDFLWFWALCVITLLFCISSYTFFPYDSFYIAVPYSWIACSWATSPSNVSYYASSWLLVQPCALNFFMHHHLFNFMRAPCTILLWCTRSFMYAQIGEISQEGGRVDIILIGRYRDQLMHSKFQLIQTIFRENSRIYIFEEEIWWLAIKNDWSSSNTVEAAR